MPYTDQDACLSYSSRGALHPSSPLPAAVDPARSRRRTTPPRHRRTATRCSRRSQRQLEQRRWARWSCLSARRHGTALEPTSPHVARFLSPTRLAIPGIVGSSNCPSVPDKLIVREPTRDLGRLGHGKLEPNSLRPQGGSASLAGDLSGRSSPCPGGHRYRPEAGRCSSPAEGQPLLPEGRDSQIQAPGRRHRAAASRRLGCR